MFNLLSSLCDLERYSEAEPLLPEVKELAAALRKDLDRVRVVWLSGKVAAGLGRTAEAHAGWPTTALVSLDLAKLLLEHGRTAEVRALA